MANRLKMAIIHSIQLLHSLHWSQRRIARELGIDRETVRKYLECGWEGANPAISPAGSEGSKPATCSGLPGPVVAGIDPDDRAEDEGDSKPALVPACGQGDGGGPKPAISPTGSDESGAAFRPVGHPAPSAPTDVPRSVGRSSACAPFRDVILAMLKRELSAQRIYQDLVAEHGFTASYDSVKRFVRKLSVRRGLPLRRLETAPGVEAQVDFGTGAPVIGADGKRRRTHVFRIVLSHSRKAYSEVTFRQTTEDFIACLENAFAQFGGCPQTLVIDNLRAAVKHPDWFDPELVPKLAAFCAHYGVAILPTRPYMPRHKGKVESGVKYVQNNALKGRTFDSLAEQNAFLLHWERSVADTRIHGTTRRQVGKVFEEVERAALRPLPLERFPFFHEGQRVVNRDGHVEVAKAYYSVPPEYLTRTVWVRWDARLVRIFNHRFEQIALHVRHEQGRFSTLSPHIAREKISGLERGAAYLLSKASLIGDHTRRWSEVMLTARGIAGTRVLLGLLALTKKHPSESLETACEMALSHGAFRLRVIRQLLKRPGLKQEPLPFLDEHPLIRPLDDYGRIVAQALERKAPSPHDGDHLQSGFLRQGWANECPSEQSGPGGMHRQGRRDIHPPRSGYPFPGCTSREPESVSPDASIVRPSPSSSQEKSNHE
jgi:transposase